ncbi:metallophosphoesterase family protein [Chloroflexota bacterium]
MSLIHAESKYIFEVVSPRTASIRVGLIADTHIPRDIKTLPPHVKEAFKDVELILHAGDIYVPGILDELETIAPVLAAQGNGDEEFPSDRRLDERQLLSIAGLNVGLTHAINYPGSPNYPLDEVMDKEFGKHMDIIVFGDTHVAMVERYNGILLVNPGSPTLPNGRYELGTVAILEITENRSKARIVQLNEFSLPFSRELIYYLGAGA